MIHWFCNPCLESRSERSFHLIFVVLSFITAGSGVEIIVGASFKPWIIELESSRSMLKTMKISRISLTIFFADVVIRVCHQVENYYVKLEKSDVELVLFQLNSVLSNFKVCFPISQSFQLFTCPFLKKHLVRLFGYHKLDMGRFLPFRWKNLWDRSHDFRKFLLRHCCR